MSDPSECTMQTCPLDMAYIEYQPSVAGNAILLGVFGVMVIGQLGLGFIFRTWSFMLAMVAGLILEVLGYLGRIMLHNNPFSFEAFLLYLICLTIAPAFFTAGIYLCLGRIVSVYGTEFSRLKPRTYTYIFVSGDLISLVLQAAGGAVTSIADDNSLRDIGVYIMISGLAFQVASLAGFMVLAVEYGFRVRRGKSAAGVASSDRESWKPRAFLVGLAIATLTIFVRSTFRVAELQGGFHSKLANDEISLMVLEGAMVAIACTCLTLLHPVMLTGKNWSVQKLLASRVEAKDRELGRELS